MVDVNDVRGLRVARAELSKRGIDTMRADVRMMHGVLYVRGTIVAMPGCPIPDIQHEMDHIVHILRQKPEIRDVIIDCTFGATKPSSTNSGTSNASVR
jgi:hypothetical protein